MSTVTIGADNYTIYGTYAGAVTYHNGRLGPSVTWLGLSADNRARTLVQSAEFLDALVWDEEWDEFAERDAEPAIVQASYALAGYIAVNADVVGAATPRSVRAVRTKSLTLEFEGAGDVTGQLTLPPWIEMLLRPFLTRARGVGNAKATGTCDESTFEDPDKFGLTSGP